MQFNEKLPLYSKLSIQGVSGWLFFPIENENMQDKECGKQVMIDDPKT